MLFEPITIKGIHLRNRLVFPPMGTYLATADGGVTQEHREHYLARAQAGVGLIVLEHAFITPQGKARSNQLGIDSDAKIPGLAALVGVLHQAGAKVVAQLNHAGSNTRAELIGAQPLGASAVEHPKSHTVPREMEMQDIESVINSFTKAALRAQAAGCDGVEIHCCHGYLLNQFLSPITNRRQDRYGRDLEGRMRLPLEIVKAVRRVVGPDYLLLFRLAGDDMLPGGVTLAESKLVAREAVAAGVDVLDISGGLGGYSPEAAGPAYFLPLASAIKQVVSVPVICTGGIREPHLADRIVRDGKADLVGVGRAQFVDPQWAVKARKILE